MFDIVGVDAWVMGKVSPHHSWTELELGLIQTQMAQKPMLRAEVYAHAMRASQNRNKEVRREKEPTSKGTIINN